MKINVDILKDEMVELGIVLVLLETVMVSVGLKIRLRNFAIVGK